MSQLVTATNGAQENTHSQRMCNKTPSHKLTDKQARNTETHSHTNSEFIMQANTGGHKANIAMEQGDSKQVGHATLTLHWQRDSRAQTQSQ